MFTRNSMVGGAIFAVPHRIASLALSSKSYRLGCNSTALAMPLRYVSAKSRPKASLSAACTFAPLLMQSVSSGTERTLHALSNETSAESSAVARAARPFAQQCRNASSLGGVPPSLDSSTQVETRPEFRLHQLRLQNFKKFEDITFTLTPSPKIIVGANGSGKTQILWAILIFLRGHNARVPSSKHFSKDVFRFEDELEDLFGDRFFRNKYQSPDTLVRVGAPNKKFTLTGTFHDTTYHHTNENVMLEYSLDKGLLQDKPDNHQSLAPIRFAFMPSMYQWGALSEERTRAKMFLTAGVQHLRPRLFQAKDFVNDGLRHLGLQATVSAVRDGVDGPVTATVTENGVTLDIGACAGSLQKIIAILTLLYHLTEAATIKAAQDDARGKNIQHDSNTFAQRIFLIDELEALLYENVTAKLYEFLVSTCAQHNIQLIVATNSRAIIEPRLNTKREVLFLTPDGKAVELTGELPTDEQNQQSLFPVLNALSQVKNNNMPLLVLEGVNDQKFYGKYTELGEKFQFMTTAGAVKKEGVSHILRQANLKHVFLSDSDMYAASSDLADAQKRMTKHVGSSVVYTQLPCVESYLILSEMLERAEEAYELRHKAIKVLVGHKLYFVNSFKSMLKEVGPEPSTMPIKAEQKQRTKEEISGMTFEELNALSSDEFGQFTKQEKHELFQKARQALSVASASTSATDRLFPKLRLPLNASSNDPEEVWTAMHDKQSDDASSSSFDPVGFWTTYVKMVHGKEAMVRGPDGTPMSTDEMIDRTKCLHPKVQALLDQTVETLLNCLSEVEPE
ncbi:hypothetical protein CAOG_009271 [Capsaspora owczarzaki ATCC 30864]|uniref:AAA+ ATPase domain-containing protein n=1 Tax=Capsaspora owczarzaki (strain ATCC 30864) TaxID=595528 RepID=A0A0D2TZT7_CAPO3|nr:hypothetical protein CAOG_009271 [Capsaspora owczarzaki ATCC 30864]